MNEDFVFINFCSILLGPNLSGAEFNPGPDKRYSYDYIYPSTDEIDYYSFKGFGII